MRRIVGNTLTDRNEEIIDDSFMIFEEVPASRVLEFDLLRSLFISLIKLLTTQLSPNADRSSSIHYLQKAWENLNEVFVDLDPAARMVGRSHYEAVVLATRPNDVDSRILRKFDRVASSNVKVSEVEPFKAEFLRLLKDLVSQVPPHPKRDAAISKLSKSWAAVNYSIAKSGKVQSFGLPPTRDEGEYARNVVDIALAQARRRKA